MRAHAMAVLAAVAVLLIVGRVGCDDAETEDVKVVKMTRSEVAEINEAAESPRKDHLKKSGKGGKKPKPTTTTMAPENEEDEDISEVYEDVRPVAIDVDLYHIDENDEDSDERRQKRRRRPKPTTARPMSAQATAATFDPISSAEQLNVRELKFQPMEDKKFNKRSADYVGAFLIAANEDAPADVAAGGTEETAPPDVEIPPGQLVDEDDVVKQMRAARLHIHSAGDYHRGGNAPTINFEDALRVTVPYNEAPAKAKTRL